MLKDPVSLLIGLAIVAVFAIVIVILAKREGNSLKDILAKVPEDRKNQLKQSIFVPSDKKNLHFSDGLVADVVEKGDKVEIILLFYVERLDDYFFRKVKISQSECKKKNIIKLNFIKCYMKYDKEMEYYDFKSIA